MAKDLSAEEVRDAYIDLEGSLNAVKNMAGLLCAFSEMTFDRRDEHKRGAYFQFSLTNEQLEQLMFATYEVKSFVGEALEQYYANYPAQPHWKAA